MDEEKKQVGVTKFIVPIVAVSIFALALFGAGYAYFAASVSTNEVANISTQLPNTTTTISTSSSECTMEILPGDMSQAKNNTTVPVNVANNTNNCYLAVTLNGSAGVSCTYNLVLQETSTNAYAITQVGDTPANYNGFEFTGTISVNRGSCSDAQYTDPTQCAANSGTWTTASSPNANAVSTGFAFDTETQMDTLSGKAGANPTVVTNGVLSTATIAVTTDDVAVTHFYTMSEKWYNIPHDQGVHAGETYSYVLKADNIVC